MCMYVCMYEVTEMGGGRIDGRRERERISTNQLSPFLGLLGEDFDTTA